MMCYCFCVWEMTQIAGDHLFGLQLKLGWPVIVNPSQIHHCNLWNYLQFSKSMFQQATTNQQS